MKKRFILSYFILIVLILIGSVNAYPITAVTNKIIYVINDHLTITGTVDTTNPVTITATVYNSTGSTIDVLTDNTAGGSTNTFSTTSTINDSYNPGNYILLITDGTDTINMSIRVISKSILLGASPINSGDDVINVSTDIQITTDNALGGNFTELLSLSESSTKTLHYGNYSIGGKLYHFVLVDQTNASVYDRLYVDDDKDFRFFNDAEDSGSAIDIEYQALKKGSVLSNGTFKYIVGEIERTTGDKIVLWTKPKGKPPYSTSDVVNFIVIARNNTRLLSQGVSVDILNSTGQKITSTNTYSTGNFGWFNVSVNLSNVPNLPAGIYVISLNDSLGIMPFPVEAFKLFVTITDLSNNPTSDFAPNSKARINIVSKDSSGPRNLTTFTVNVYYPDGTIVSKTKTDFTQISDGIYRYDLDLTDAPNGGYAVSITGTIGANTQKAPTGFEIQTINFEAETINTKYVEEAEGAGTMINAFAPNSNVTIMTFLSNISEGGMMEKGPEGMTGLLSPGDCNSTVTLTEVKDENGDSYSVNYLSMNLSDALNYLYPTDPIEDVPQNILDQCMIIFETPSKNGIYKAEVKINYQGEERYAGASFGVQRLWAVGDTVDFKGEEFGFFAPNSTVRIKLKVTDLETDEELPATNITSAKIIELEREFPSFKDILADETLRNNLNESIANGTISFTSPVDEGFYIMKFRFTAYVDGQTETGIGDAFFMLKKYMVWGELAGAEEGRWFVKQGKNITLSVTVLDIDKAQTYFGGYSSQMSCTGCGGFIINVSEVRNDQQFKRVTEYTVLTGTITNTTNPVSDLTIVPTGTDMQPGWYSVDLVVTDPSTNETYFGWGWFEIRNFWAEIPAVKWNGSHYLLHAGEGGPGGGTYKAGGKVEFTVIAKEPFSDQFLTQTSPPSVESVQWFVGYPPVPISGYSTSVSTEDIVVCFDEKGEECQLIPNQYVVTISNLPSDKQGDFQVNVKVTTTEGSDIGSFWFDFSSYLVESEYRMNSWPPLFANTENFTINFTATDFEDKPHKITNVTIDRLEDRKLGRPIKMKYGKNYTTYCDFVDSCSVDLYLTNLPTGEYFVMFSIVDDENNKKSEEAEFKIQNKIVGIPSIEEAWVWENNQVSKKIDNDVRKGEWTWCGDERESIPNGIKLCQDYCPPDEPCQEFNLTVPNVSYEKEVFGYIPLMEEWAIGEFGDVADKSRVWMYFNGSHMWINDTPKTMYGNEYWRDLRETTPIAIGDTFTDNKGGLWELDAVGDHSIMVTGLTTLYKTGVLINTSYSKSGIIKIGPIREDELGAFTPQGRTGIDLNDDGFTNGTVYFAITDNATAGVYDTFFFSTDGNFTGNAASGIPNPILVNNPDRTKREFGFGSNLTLLSIGPRAQMLLFYSRQIGDWAHMRDVKYNSNITIPIIVASPDGSPQSANVSITGYKNMRNWLFTSSDILTREITGVDEISFNSSLVGKGEYAFAIKTDEMMEEWKWPMATVRGYLVDGDMGEATYVTNFQSLPLKDYRWDTPGVKITRIQRDARNDTPEYTIDGILGDVYEMNPWEEGCQVFDSTGNITDSVLNQTVFPSKYGFMGHHTDDHGYFFYNSTSGVLYRNTTDCWFDLSASQTTYQEGSHINIERDGKIFNATILTIDRDMYNIPENPIVYQENANSTNYTYNGTLTSPTNFFDGSWSTWAVLSENGSVANFYSNYTVPGGKNLPATKWKIRDGQSGEMNLTLDSGCVAYSEGSGKLVLNFMVNEEGGQYRFKWRCWNGTEYVDLRNYCCYFFGRGTEEGIYWYEYVGRSWRTDFGVAGINASILPMVDNPYGHPDWKIEWGYMQNVSIFGTYYDVILANDTYNYHPRCIFEPSPDGQCANKAWLVPTSIGNFSSPQAIGVTIGQNFTSDLYLAAVGPNDGDGITVGNFSALTVLGLPQYPAIGGIDFADDTTSYFTIVNESELNMDLDKNDSSDGVFYMLVFDSDFNSKKNLTSNLVDDDLEFLPWSVNIENEEIQYDFTDNEIYTYDNITEERWCDLPSGIWTGCAQFGGGYPDEKWENQPHWNVPFYNITHMLLRKDRWEVDSDQPVDILLNIYNFDQTPISGANISITKMARSSPFIGFQVLSTADYTVDETYNVTDSYGYGLLKILPSPSWSDGEYQVIVKIQSPQGTETWERWFCVGSC